MPYVSFMSKMPKMPYLTQVTSDTCQSYVWYGNEGVKRCVYIPDFLNVCVNQWIRENKIRQIRLGMPSNKNFTKSGKSPKRGGGVSVKFKMQTY